MGLTLEEIESQIESETCCTLGKKTTAVTLTLKNGFEITGTSACVCASEYSEEVGKPYARQRAIDQLWQLEGYKAQVAKAEQASSCCSAAA